MKNAPGVNADSKCTPLFMRAVNLLSNELVRLLYTVTSIYMHICMKRKRTDSRRQQQQKKRGKKIAITKGPHLPPLDGMAHSIHMAQNDIIFHRKYMQTDANIKRNSIYHTQRIHIL